MADPNKNIIDGKKMSEEIQAEIQTEVEKLKKEHNLVPGIGVVLVGERADSQTYVRHKKLAAEKVGMHFVLKEVTSSITQKELLAIVQQLNDDPKIHGLIVQLPLPDHINDKEILNAVSYEKDIDGFHPLNQGALVMKGREPSFIPCTPKGCVEMLDRLKISLEGKQVVVLGRSNVVGIPAAMLCLNRNATVTICHSKTQNLPQVVKQADILIAAVGKAELVKKDWVKEGAVVIDVGINKVDDNTKKLGYKLVGDVDFTGVKEVASLITPVPGGVGPMTVAMLLQNTLASAKRHLSKQAEKH